MFRRTSVTDRWLKLDPALGVKPTLLPNLYLRWFDALFYRDNRLGKSTMPIWCLTPMFLLFRVIGQSGPSIG